jgi:hypothetical protein
VLTKDGAYMTKTALFRPRAFGLSGVITLLALALTAGPALAQSPLVDSAACAAHPLSQPFLASSDAGWYAHAPGESADSLYGTGWTLTGGAQIVQTQLADGATGSVLELPSGSQAVSPLMCVSSHYSQARAMVRDVVGGGGVSVSVAYAGTSTWGNPHHAGDLNGQSTNWTLSGQINLQPANQSGWQLVQFTLTAGGNNGKYQVYDLAARADATLAAASVDTSACAPPQLTQPFLKAGDPAFYTLAPGESADSFDGTGWTLSGGATIVPTQMPDGTTTSVLDLPAGSKAISPVMCVTSEYPHARAEVRSVLGGGGVRLYVAYNGTTTWNAPRHSGDLNGPGRGWGLSGRAGIQPGHDSGWQLVQFTLVPSSDKGEYQILNFEVDPRCRY